MHENRKEAEDATFILYGVNGRNDKSDAFRHAYFNAMNERDCKYFQGEGIAKLFSDAHETTTPAHLLKESQMDVYNNTVGQSVEHGKGILYLNTSFISDVMSKMLSGELVYLSPIWYSDPNFQNTGGITSATLLIPTNQ